MPPDDTTPRRTKIIAPDLPLPRRTLVAGVATLLSGCDRLSEDPTVQQFLGSATRLTRLAQRLVSGRQALAPEYTQADLSPHFKSNGTSDPDDDDYQALVANNFTDWRLQVDGLVRNPGQFSLDDLRALPSRTQITRHDCVEGWSCIGKWKGAILAGLLSKVEPQPTARYAVFHCADPMENGDPDTKYYESIDLGEASHPQTILAYEMNDTVLPVAHGAPLRLRVERQLGYKMAKYIMRIELVESFARIRSGKGGYWEDLGYAWYAGI
jgi:DMSO/TMAO reductase YedYZ molybdopterin-dependent catalytic subunit